jgi:hypothetical protein
MQGKRVFKIKTAFQTGDLMLQGAENTYCASFCVERDQYLGVAGRGGWHDPDELLVGNTNCSCKSDNDKSTRKRRFLQRDLRPILNILSLITWKLTEEFSRIDWH